ncbi:lytic murein transglycosylase [Sphingomonas naphthae]|uniref:Lytic murein transglycosylase n=2 Tax=Sphingomonas naphthae TaxID=1813468 RepID=A0ABY7TQJ9_9SPHN|nr:lytic murein transglycosylase [Sphingomonas naphthae]WCT75418.1 lytic murein transglycosylase [Sphingomonas naphthae]
MRTYLTGLRPRALAEGVRPETFDSVLASLTFNQRVVDLDRSQPGGFSGNPAPPPPFAPYKAAHVEPYRIGRGKRKMEALAPMLARIEAQTGVSGAIVLAIYGQETGYGAVTGNFDLLRSLASLAYEGRRRALFSGEYIAALKMLDRGAPRDLLKGSWAGATGYPQFLPSTYIRLGADGDGDGKVDIWANEADALASIARYLLDAGWKPGVPWGVPVRVPPTLDRVATAPLARSPECQKVFDRHSRWLTVGEWRALGIQPLAARAPADTELAALIEPDGIGATGYLLTTNFRPILAYNCSNHYALSVALLADAIVE